MVGSHEVNWAPLSEVAPCRQGADVGGEGVDPEVDGSHTFNAPWYRVVTTRATV